MSGPVEDHYREFMGFGGPIIIEKLLVSWSIISHDTGLTAEVLRSSLSQLVKSPGVIWRDCNCDLQRSVGRALRGRQVTMQLGQADVQ